ncbi:MAG: 2-succinyl-5-enolpyruvyl-6-hydroxy-3-cyclohexene-1-carboxylic-acid synthase, partial [Halobacteriales archaeon]|nr:2-succinyl-5-enolpyruvyl-6-hydroxy-3-cyclohexene-1-carboxylic-acid synthase [Halobacteriales archaeon]
MRAAHALAEELSLAGVQHAVVCPGNRSGPLAFGLAAQPMTLWGHIDERSAGYFALGLARAARSPVAVVCTSGTAAANLLPAAVEAWHARVPLVLVTADRPRDLRDVGANQAIHQAGIFGAHARWACDLPEPSDAPRVLRLWRLAACRAVAESLGPPAGPVHLNAPFVKPLEPGPGEAMPARAERPFVGATRAAPRPLLPEARQGLRAALALGRG